MDEKETVLGSQGTIILEENVDEYIRNTNKEAERKIPMKKRERKYRIKPLNVLFYNYYR